LVHVSVLATSTVKGRKLEGKSADWMEKVTNEQYQG